MAQPGVTGVLCADKQGLALAGKFVCVCACLIGVVCVHVCSTCCVVCSCPANVRFHASHDELFHMIYSHYQSSFKELSVVAQGTLKPEAAGLISGLAEKAMELKHGTGADDQPVVVVEFDTGYVWEYKAVCVSP